MTDRTSDPFAIDEAAFPLQNSGDEGPPLAGIEARIRQLIRERATALSELGEAKESHERDKKRLLLDLLEVLDAFERVFASVEKKEDQVTPQMKRWLKNFRAAQRLMQSILEHRGVRELDTAAGEFDPHWHEAVEVVADPDVAEGQILRQEYKGYLRLGKMLRKSGVTVAGEDEKEAEEEAEH